MSAAEFKKLVSKYFSPEIRKLGWKGSGFNYYKKESNGIIKIFGMYGSWMGGSIYCETGIDFDFLPNESHEKTQRIKRVSECLIRERLSIGGWNFNENATQNIKTVQSILMEFLSLGTKFYDDFDHFPHPFDKIKAKDLRTNANFKLCGKYDISNSIFFSILLKDINLHLNRKEIAREFSEFGIERTNKLSKKLLVGRKSKSYKQTETSIKILLKKLEME